MQRLQCPVCRQVVDEYCTINDRMSVCPPCAVNVRSQVLTVTNAKILRGAAAGAGAALVMWLACGLAAFVEESQKDLSWVGYLYAIGSIFTGAVVGKAVSRGAGLCGGRILQAIAIGFSVLSLAFALFFAMAHKVHTQNPDTNMVGVLAIALVVAPFVYAFNMTKVVPIAWLGFSVYDAWRRNKVPVLDVKGPFPVDQAAPAPPPVAGDARAAGMVFERPVQ